jgi:hypothetical protein
VTPEDAAVQAVACPSCLRTALNRQTGFRRKVYCMFCGHKPERTVFARRRGITVLLFPPMTLPVPRSHRHHRAA